jgi:hypothetical protein
LVTLDSNVCSRLLTAARAATCVLILGSLRAESVAIKRSE